MRAPRFPRQPPTSRTPFTHPQRDRPFVVPYRRPLLLVYVRKALEAIDEVAD